jgi:hypothetical protein
MLSKLHMTIPRNVARIGLDFMAERGV